MKKIPVGATIAQPFGFVVRNFFNILGIMAVPMLVMWLPSLLLRSQIAAMDARMAAGDYSAVTPLWQFLLPLYVACFLLMAIHFLGLDELAKGTKQAPRWLYFSLGRPIWRLFGSILFLILLIVLGWVA